MNEERDKPGTLVRMALPDDAPNIASVLREAFAEYEPLYTREALAATTPTGEHVLGRMWARVPCGWHYAAASRSVLWR